MRYTCIVYPAITRRWQGVSTMTQLENPFKDFQNESGAIKDTDAMGREKFWEDLGRPSDDGK